MVAYTRQSTISDGDTITAALFNDEYNQLLSAFSYASSGTTGHKHDGTAGEGGNIPQIGDQDFLNKIVTDSTNNRFGIFVQVSSSAVEQIRIQDGAIVPVTDNDIDLGTSSVEFKDAFFDGTVTTDALVADTADINGGSVDGATIGANSASTGAFTTLTSSGTIEGTTITATTAFVPDASDGAALGTSSLEFSDLFLADGAVISFGDDDDVTLTHVADTGLLLSGTSQLQFNDASQNITAPSATVLDINATDEIELNATLVDINANVEVSGTLTVAGAVDFGDAALSNVGAVQLDSIAGDGDTNTSITFSGSDVITIATGGTTAMTIDASQNVAIAGDLTITGDDLTMGTNTSGMLLIADGTNFNPTAVTSLSEISTVANDDVFLAIDTSGGGLKKIARSAIVSGLATSSAISNVVEDTSPQLGANLDTNSHNILIDDAHFIGDENGNEQIIFQTTSSAVNQIDVTNAATGNAPEISATGDDTNISLKLTPKGTGQVVIDGNVGIETGVIDLKNGGSQSAVRLYCESSNAHYAAIQAPAHSDFSGNVTLTLPATTDTLTGIAATQTLTNKTLTTPVIAEIDSGSTITLDATTDIVLDAGGDEVIFKDGSTNVGHVSMDSDNLTIKSLVSDKDMIFQGNDGGSGITALTLDMSAAGAATFNDAVTSGAVITSGAGLVIADGGNIGSASDTDAIAIASNGVVTFSQVPVLPDDTVATADIQDNAVTLAKLAGIARGKIIVGDSNGDPSVLSAGSNGTFLKSDGTDLSFAAPSVALDDVATGDDAVLLATSSGNITIDAQGNDTNIIFKGTDNNSDTTFLTIDGSEAGAATFNNAITSGAVITSGAGLVIADGGNIGSASDTDAIAIASNGVVTFSQNPVFPDGSIPLADLDIDGGTDISADLTDADLIIVDDGAGGTNRKAALSRIKTYIGTTGNVRNYINNPEFSVHQRSNAITATTLGTQNDDGSYTLDQWVLLSDGDDIVDVKATESDAPTGSKKAMELEVETANKKFGVVQFIENVNCESIIGQEVTLSFQAKATSDLDDVRAAIIAWDGNEDAPTKDIVSAWESEGTNPTLVSNMTYENTPADLNVTTSFAKYSVTATIDTSGAKNVAVFIWSNVTGTTAADDGSQDKLHIGQVQLEKGDEASDFVFESYTDHLQRCQRYFQGYNVDAAGIGTSAIFTSVGHAYTTSARFRVPLVTPMRIGPTQTFENLRILGKSSSAVTSSTYTARTTDENVTTIGGNYSYSTNSAFNTPSGLNGGSQFFAYLDTSGFIQFSAELGV
jgi:ribosomal protein L27